jgi:hypothetical protein
LGGLLQLSDEIPHSPMNLLAARPGEKNGRNFCLNRLPEMGVDFERVGADQNHTTYNETTLQEVNVDFYILTQLNLKTNVSLRVTASPFRVRKNRSRACGVRESKCKHTQKRLDT